MWLKYIQIHSGRISFTFITTLSTRDTTISLLTRSRFGTRTPSNKKSESAERNAAPENFTLQGVHPNSHWRPVRQIPFLGVSNVAAHAGERRIPPLLFRLSPSGLHDVQGN